uniref:PH domain-containing protein n=1 Tax=Trichuris muris TaxID=70415 RepID=A0A5S6QJG2_TRIMR
MFIYPSVPVDFDHLLSLGSVAGNEGDDASIVSGAAFVSKLHFILFESRNSNASNSDGGIIVGDYVHHGELVGELQGLFENRLKNPRSTCWPFIKQFLPRSQIEILKKCTIGRSTKCRVRLWLGSSINDRSLFWLFGSIVAARETRIRFYLQHALMRDDEVLEAISSMLLRAATLPILSHTTRQSLSRADETSSSMTKNREAVINDKMGRVVKVSAAEIGEDTSSYCQLSQDPEEVSPLPERSHVRKTKVWAPVIEEGNSNDCDTSGLEFEPYCLDSSLHGKCYQRRPTPEGSIRMPIASSTEDECRSVEPKSFEGDSGLIDEKAALDAAFSLMSSKVENAYSNDSSSVCSARRASFDNVIPEQPSSGVQLTESHSSSTCDSEKAASASAVRSDFTHQILHHLESVSEVLASYSDGLGKGEFESNRANEKASGIFAPAILPSSNESRMANLEDGEVILESGEVVELAVHVFTEEAEQFYKMFRFYHGHQKGAFEIRHLVLTSRAVYVVNRSSIGNSTLSFARDFGAPFSKLNDISVGLGSQTITFHLAHGKGEYVVCTCSQQLTRAILSALEVSIRRHTAEGKSRPLVINDCNKQRLTLSKWMSSELSSVPLPVLMYALVFWYPNVDSNCAFSGLGRSGFLYCRRMSRPRVWPRYERWKQDYFILRGQKLYQFEDSSCKVGKRVYDLKKETSACRDASDEDYEFAFEMPLTLEGGALQFSCPTRNELVQWKNAILQAISDAEALTGAGEHSLACCCVLTDGYIFLGRETNDANFICTLAFLELRAVRSAQVLRSDNCVSLDIDSKEEDNRGKWLLSFAAAQELHDFVKCLSTLLPELRLESFDGHCELSSACSAAARRWKASV